MDLSLDSPPPNPLLSCCAPFQPIPHPANRVALEACRTDREETGQYPFSNLFSAQSSPPPRQKKRGRLNQESWDFSCIPAFWMPMVEPNITVDKHHGRAKHHGRPLMFEENPFLRKLSGGNGHIVSFDVHKSSQVKSSHLYLYSAFNNTNCNKALHNIKIGKFVNNVKWQDLTLNYLLNAFHYWI